RRPLSVDAQENEVARDIGPRGGDHRDVALCVHVGAVQDQDGRPRPAGTASNPSGVRTARDKKPLEEPSTIFPATSGTWCMYCGAGCPRQPNQRGKTSVLATPASVLPLASR